MSKTQPVPGDVTAVEQRGGWVWRWRSPKGNEHIGVQRFATEKTAKAAGRKAIRALLRDQSVEDEAVEE